MTARIAADSLEIPLKARVKNVMPKMTTPSAPTIKLGRIFQNDGFKVTS
jgi:hypothetical protein